jgi:hypothetical protein
MMRLVAMDTRKTMMKKCSGLMIVCLVSGIRICARGAQAASNAWDGSERGNGERWFSQSQRVQRWMYKLQKSVRRK